MDAPVKNVAVLCTFSKGSAFRPLGLDEMWFLKYAFNYFRFERKMLLVSAYLMIFFTKLYSM